MSRFAVLMLSTVASAALIAAASPAAAVDSTHGAIEGTTTSQGGASLNGMCGILYDKRGSEEIVQFAPTGTDGTFGHYIQDNIDPGTYKLLFVNCGANTDGQNPDYHYTPILYGSTWKIGSATKIVVRANAVTTLAPQPIPYGGVVQGVVTDTTTGQGADTPVVAIVPPGGDTFFLSFSWTLLCAGSTGTYDTTSGFHQGVPDGSRIVFAPNNWGCEDSQGIFNAGKFFPSHKKLAVVDGGTTTANGKIAETGQEVAVKPQAPADRAANPMPMRR